MKTLAMKKLNVISLIALMAGSLGGCASGPGSRWCSFDARRPAEKRGVCYNMKHDYDSNGLVKPSRKNKFTYFPVPSLSALSGIVFVPPGDDQANLRACLKKTRETGTVDCGEFE